MFCTTFRRFASSLMLPHEPCDWRSRRGSSQVTGLSRLVYAFHHEPFLPDAPQWSFPPAGPLSSANGALPWIVLARDRVAFEREFPTWEIEKIEPLMPLVYLLSGGMSMRGLMPAWSYRFWVAVERGLSRFRYQIGMFALIVLRHRRA
jgi:hypothetical protein